MYQQDAQHTGRSPYAGPRQMTLLRQFDTSLPQNLPPEPATPRADFQSSSAIGPDGTIYVANFPGRCSPCATARRPATSSSSSGASTHQRLSRSTLRRR